MTILSLYLTISYILLVQTFQTGTRKRQPKNTFGTLFRKNKGLTNGSQQNEPRILDYSKPVPKTEATKPTQLQMNEEMLAKSDKERHLPKNLGDYVLKVPRNSAKKDTIKRTAKLPDVIPNSQPNNKKKDVSNSPEADSLPNLSLEDLEEFGMHDKSDPSTDDSKLEEKSSLEIDPNFYVQIYLIDNNSGGKILVLIVQPFKSSFTATSRMFRSLQVKQINFGKSFCEVYSIELTSDHIKHDDIADLLSEIDKYGEEDGSILTSIFEKLNSISSTQHIYRHEIKNIKKTATSADYELLSQGMADLSWGLRTLVYHELELRLVLKAQMEGDVQKIEWGNFFKKKEGWQFWEDKAWGSISSEDLDSLRQKSKIVDCQSIEDKKGKLIMEGDSVACEVIVKSQA